MAKTSTSTDIVATATDQLVIDRVTYANAGMLLNLIGDAKDDVKDRLGEQVKAAWNAHKVAKAQLDRHLKPLEDAAAILRARMEAYVKKDEDAPGPVQVVELWDFKVEDEEQLPPQYMIVDLAAIRSAVRAQKGETRIPGVRVFRKHQVRQASKAQRRVTRVIE